MRVCAAVRTRARDCECLFPRGVAQTGLFGQNPPALSGRRRPKLNIRNARMKSVIFSVRLFAARFALLAACALTLAACQTEGTGPTAADAPRIQASRPPEPAQVAEPMTRSRAARECWMRTEKGSAHENLDKRADVVNKCIEEKMKAAGTHSPKT